MTAMAKRARPGAGGYRRFVLVFACLALVSAPEAQAADTVGAATRIKNTVTGTEGNRRLAVKQPVFMAEKISAAADSFGEIELADGARVLVGENSEISLDEFVVADSTFSSASIAITRGAFRMISGKSPKGAFNLRTPLANIGVRGTVFDVYVHDGGITDVVLIRGIVVVCAANGPCETASRACDIVRVSAPDQVTRQPFLRSPERPAAQERSLFGLLRQQTRFSSGYRVPLVACNDRAAQFNRGGNSDGQRDRQGQQERDGRGTDNDNDSDNY